MSWQFWVPLAISLVSALFTSFLWWDTRRMRKATEDVAEAAKKSAEAALKSAEAAEYTAFPQVDVHEYKFDFREFALFRPFGGSFRVRKVELEPQSEPKIAIYKPGAAHPLPYMGDPVIREPEGLLVLLPKNCRRVILYYSPVGSERVFLKAWERK